MRTAAAFAWVLILPPAALGAASGALPPSGVSIPAEHPDAKLHSSPDGRFRWAEGARFVSVWKRPFAKQTDAVRLPPLAPRANRRAVLFARRGEFFCVLDEERSEVGLHLDAMLGAKAAKALVVGATLHLMDSGGRLLWSKRMPDTHRVGAPDASGPMRIARGGTLAVLLQDADPLAKTRALLLVIAPGGRQELRLDYVAWKTIDEFALSDDGRYLAVRGYGRVDDIESWSAALGLYRLGSGARWVKALDGASPARVLSEVGDDGTVCCVQFGQGPVAYSAAGELKILSADEAARLHQAP